MKYTVLILSILLFTACGSNEQRGPEQQDIPADALTVTGAWARPASEGGNSAVYLTLLNGYSTADTLIGVSSEAAELVQVHESYEQENGLAGMRRVETLAIGPRSSISFEPGGYHIMLMRLSNDLGIGNRVRLTLMFSKSGTLTINVPVRSQASNTEN